MRASGAHPPVAAQAVAAPHAPARNPVAPQRTAPSAPRSRCTAPPPAATGSMAAAKIDAAAAKAKALDMLEFINAAWTPYHAVEEAAQRLAAAGFEHIAEKDAWNLKPGELCVCAQ